MPTNRYRTEDNMTISLPPFRGAVKWLMLINLGIFIAWELLGLASPEAAGKAAVVLGLVPQAVIHGWVWQIVSYAFLHLGVWHLAGNLVGIWFVGSLVEGMFGTRRFVRFYCISLLGAAAGCILLSYSGAAPASHTQLIAGASGANYGLLLAVGMLMGDTEFMMFPLPIQIKAKYLVGIVLAIAVLMSLSGPGAIVNAGLLGGLFAAFLYIKFWGRSASSRPYAPASGVGRGLSDRVYAVAPAKSEPFMARMKNKYHLWKRRRMAKKFEVYMRKHDRSVYFDEHGNYKGHEVQENDKPDGDGKGGWVN